MLWNEGSGASSFLCRTERFGLETSGGLCRLWGALKEERPRGRHWTDTPAYCGALYNSAMDSFRVQTSRHISRFCNTPPDDKHQDWLYLVIFRLFYSLAAISRSVLTDTERKCCRLNKT